MNSIRHCMGSSRIFSEAFRGILSRVFLRISWKFFLKYFQTFLPVFFYRRFFTVFEKFKWEFLQQVFFLLCIKSFSCIFRVVIRDSSKNKIREFLMSSFKSSSCITNGFPSKISPGGLQWIFRGFSWYVFRSIFRNLFWCFCGMLQRFKGCFPGILSGAFQEFSRSLFKNGVRQKNSFMGLSRTSLLLGNRPGAPLRISPTVLPKYHKGEILEYWTEITKDSLLKEFLQS